MRSVAIGLALALAVVGAVLTANFVLLGYAVKRSDPVGRLSPVTHLAPLRAPPRPAVSTHQPGGEKRLEEPDD